MIAARDVERLTRQGDSARMSDDLPPRFQEGEAITAANIHPKTYTRLPRYVRGKRGVIAENRGVFFYPDAHVISSQKHPQHVYSVMFTARELWGDVENPDDKLFIDLFEDYLIATGSDGKR
jgi:nitrile hydratase